MAKTTVNEFGQVAFILGHTRGPIVTQLLYPRRLSGTLQLLTFPERGWPTRFMVSIGRLAI